MDVVLNWILRVIFVFLGLGAGVWIVRWVAHAWKHAEERWPLRIAIGMLVLAAVYAAGHARLLAQRERLEEGRLEYARYGDPRRTELRRAEVRGWLLDCTGDPTRSLALYRARAGVVERTYPLGPAGANLIGGGQDADERDYTIERLFSERLREPRGLAELGELHPAGTDFGLTLCHDLVAEMWQHLSGSGYPGAVVVQDVATGALLGYTATGGPDEAPLGIKRYAPPGSVFKLALAALWWEHGLPDDIVIPCPARIQITPRASIQNFEGQGRGEVIGPTGMLVPSCNTAAVWMAQRMREELGAEAFVNAYRDFGFLTYADEAPADTASEFWVTTSDDWRGRMSPPPMRIRISPETGPAEWGQLSIGQGPVDVTVVGVSRFVQMIGKGGVMMPVSIEQPALLEVLEELETVGRRAMSAETAQKLQVAMLRVVDEGTGRAAEPPLAGTGWDLGGKTGTAQLPNRPDDGWFAGLVFDPERRPRYTVVVYLRGGGPGGRAPAILAGRVAGFLARNTPSATAAILQEAE